MSTEIKITVPTTFITELNEYLDKTAIISAEEVQSYARDLCPVDTGALRNSIEIDKQTTEITIGSDLPYSGMIEYGTMKQAAQPFMRPALSRVVSSET